MKMAHYLQALCMKQKSCKYVGLINDASLSVPCVRYSENKHEERLVLIEAKYVCMLAK